MPERDDFEDAIVQPVDGVSIQGDNEEIKLLFFYMKPESNHDEEGVARCKCVAELRVSRLGSWTFRGTLT